MISHRISTIAGALCPIRLNPWLHLFGLLPNGRFMTVCTALLLYHLYIIIVLTVIFELTARETA